MSDKNLGLGVMIQLLFGGNETQEALQGAVGHTISGVSLQDDVILIGLNNGKTLRIIDGGQSCCEKRYITTDADLPSFVGDKIVGFELREMPSVDREYEYHDVQALVIRTDRGLIDFVTHVEHNGYYGGFALTATLTEPNVAQLQ